MHVPARAMDVQQSSFVSVQSGEHLTLNCTFQVTHSKELTVWYKQQFGELPQEVGKIIATMNSQTLPEFTSRFKVEKILDGISLTILQTKKSDEGLYFCGTYTWGIATFSSGTFIAVTGILHPHTYTVYIYSLKQLQLD